MIDEIARNLYRIQIPLPGNPLRSINSYFFRGSERCLMVDTGQNKPECLKAMQEAAGKLNIDFSKTDFFVTHQHSDHLGLVSHLVHPTAKVYMNRFEAEFIKARSPHWRITRWKTIYGANGFPEAELDRAVETQLHTLGLPKQPIDFTHLENGDIVTVGDYSLECISTPGHSPGHMCLYDRAKKLLLSGDHVLFDITPNIKVYPEMDNALKDYLDSLDKVYPLEVDLVLPGHRNFLKSLRARIDEIKEHHRRRLAECLAALERGAKTGFEIAPFVSWDMTYKSFSDFPPQQKWFALGEVMAHLQYLEAEKKVRQVQRDGQIAYSLN